MVELTRKPPFNREAYIQGIGISYLQRRRNPGLMARFGGFLQRRAKRIVPAFNLAHQEFGLVGIGERALRNVVTLVPGVGTAYRYAFGLGMTPEQRRILKRYALLQYELNADGQAGQKPYAREINRAAAVIAQRAPELEPKLYVLGGEAPDVNRIRDFVEQRRAGARNVVRFGDLARGVKARERALERARLQALQPGRKAA